MSGCLIPCRKASENTCSAESRSPDLSACTATAIFVSNEGGRFSCARARAATQKYSKRKIPRRRALEGHPAKRRGFDQRLARVNVGGNPSLSAKGFGRARLAGSATSSWIKNDG